MVSSNRRDENSHKKDEPFGELVKSMNHFFNEQPVRGFLQTMDDFFKNPFPSVPSFQIETLETEKDLLVTAELPGIKKEQIHLDILGNRLTITIADNTDHIENDENHQVYKKNQSMQYASRTITLPQPINEKKVKAHYRDGLLQISIPYIKGKKINIED